MKLRKLYLTGTIIYVLIILLSTRGFSVSPFTPTIDGFKEAGWGAVADETNETIKLPGSGVFACSNLFVCNDKNYLYIGSWLDGDPWNDSQSSHWIIVIDTNSSSGAPSGTPDPWGNTYCDPEAGSPWDLLRPDFSMLCWISYGSTNFAQGNTDKGDYFKWNGSAWQKVADVSNSDVARSSTKWSEFRIPLTLLQVQPEDTIHLLLYGVPAEGKSNASTCIPADPTFPTDYGDGDGGGYSNRFTYTIQYYLGNCWHLPDTVEAGIGTTMRDPVNPPAGYTVHFYTGNQYQGAGNPGDQSGGVLFWKRKTDTVWSQANLSWYSTSGNNKYWRASVTFPDTWGGTVIQYYFRVDYADGHHSTYIYTNNQTTASNSIASNRPYEFTLLSPPRTIDGNPSDWTGTSGSITNSAVVSSGEWIWNDAEDVRLNISYAGGSNNYELTEFRITSDSNYICFLIRFKDLTSGGYPYIGIAIDTNRALNQGQVWLGDNPETKVNTNACWEKELVVPCANVRYYETNWTSTEVGLKAVSTNNDCIEVAVLWSELGISNSGTYRFTVMVAQDSNGNTMERYGSDTMDCITPLPGETWNEVGESSTAGIIDFYFDVTFDPSTGIVADPNAPSSPVPVYPDSIKLGLNEYKPTFIWNKATDADGDNIYFYLFELSASSNFSSIFETKVITTTNYTITQSLSENKIYYWRVRAYDEHGRAGAWSTVASFTSPTPPRIIDGETNDWKGVPSNEKNVAVISSNEWIWSDKIDEARDDFSPDTDNFDFRNIRIFADASNIYFLFQMNDISSVSIPEIAIGIITDFSSGMNWLGDDGETFIGSDYKYASNFHAPDYNVIIHTTTSITTRIELFTNGGSSWFAPPTLGDKTCYIETVNNDVIEVKIARKDVGLSGNKRAGFIFASFKNAGGWANAGDTTTDIGGAAISDALDSVSIPLYLNDKQNNISAWDEELSDGDIDFWVELFIKDDGTISNLPPPPLTTPISPTNNETDVTNKPVLIWNKITDPDDEVMSYLIEISTTTNLDDTVILRINVTNTNYSITNELPDGAVCYWRVRARDKAGMLSTNAPIWKFEVKSSIQPVVPATPTFTVYIDGKKDELWGDIPTTNSPQYMSNVNYITDIYLSNDPNYLYIGWTPFGDPWDESGTGYDRSAHYAWVLETKNDPDGNDTDPFVGGTTKVNWPLLPDFWIEGWLKTGFNSFAVLYLYESINGEWMADTLKEGEDYAITLNQWGEMRLPLKRLGLKLGDKLSLLFYFRPAEDKPGVSDSIPFDPQCSDWADSSAILTSRLVYKIRYAYINCWHKPSEEDVTGAGTMRYPVSPTSLDTITLQLGIYPQDGYDSAYLVYTTNNWVSTNYAQYSKYLDSGGNSYLKVEIGPFPKNTIVKYYNRVERNGMITYNYYLNKSSITSNESFAKQYAYSFRVLNAPPSTPSVRIIPDFISTNSTIIAIASNSIDPDGDPVKYYFSWYKNGVYQDSLFTIDTNPPYTSSVPSSYLTPGDEWYCIVKGYDGVSLSEPATSPGVGVMYNTWHEVSSATQNRCIVLSNELIFFDRTNDVRDVVGDRDKFDLERFHIKVDDKFIYFLFKFKEGVDPRRAGLIVAIDKDRTGSDSSFPEIGNETGVVAGEEYFVNTGARMPDINLLFRYQNYNTPVIEYKSDTDQLWHVLNSSNGIYKFYENATFGEARISKDFLGLSSSFTLRLTVAVFDSLFGFSSDGDISYDYSGNDIVDVITAGLSDTTNIINYTSNPDTYDEETYDNDIDFWFDIKVVNNKITNNPPPSASNPSPSNGAQISTLSPVFQWNKVSETETGDNITSYRVQIAIDSNFSSPVYDVSLITNYFSLPQELPYGNINYFWRVYQRDMCGSLSTSATVWKFTVTNTRPISYMPRDDINIDNFGHISGIEDADGNVIFKWAPASDPSGIVSNLISIGTSSTSGDVTNVLLPGSQTSYTAYNLAPGYTYYARVKAKNSKGLWGEFGPPSDGIYVNKVKVDGDISDWINYNFSQNSANISNGIGIWQDATNDVRNNINILDLQQVQLIADKYNLYFLIKFNQNQPFAYGSHFIQIAIDNDNTLSAQPFIGRNISTADLFVSPEAKWEYNLKIISGSSFDFCDVCDYTYGNWKRGVYKTNSSAKVIECMVPLNYLGGADKILNKQVNISIAIFSNNNGEVKAIGGDSTPDALDLVSTGTDSASTWSEMSDQILNYYLAVNFAQDGDVNSIQGISTEDAEVPQYPSQGASSAGWIQNAIMYFIVIDRWYNGDPSNDPTGDPVRYGGDFKGIIQKLDYLLGLNINCLYLSPPEGFWGGAMGYGTSDWWNANSSFGGDDDFKEMALTLKENAIDLIIDWPGTAIGGGEVVDNHPNWAGIYKSPWGGWPEWTVGMAEVQQFMSDCLIHWASKGVRGYRLDYAKFDGNPWEHGHQYWQYVRKRLKNVFPDRYMFGEVFDWRGKIAEYVSSGDELDGCFDFSLEDYGSGGVKKWAISQSIDSSTFWNEMQADESTYGDKPIMVSFVDNHDKDRILRQAGWDSWKVRLAFGFTLTHHEVPKIFYGTEVGMDGYRIGDDLDNSPCIDPMNFAGTNYDQYLYFKRLIAGRRSFPGLRSSKFDRKVKYASGDWFIYERNYYNDAILVILHRGSSGDWAPTDSFTTWANRTWRDWMYGSDYFYTDSSGKFTGGIYVNGNDVRILVSREYGGGGYGEATVSGTVNVPGAIVRIWDYAGTIYERVTHADLNGNYTLSQVVCKDTGSETRTIEAWAPGYQIYSASITLYDATTTTHNITLTRDTTPPSAPRGLVIKPGDGIMQLTWAKNTENDMGTYVIYRKAEDETEYTKIDEVLDTAFMDNTVENGKVYYYKIRAKDINGNMSGFSREVSAEAGPIEVTFYVDVSPYTGNIEKVYLAGNSEKLGFWGIIGDHKEMEEVGNGWWKTTVEFDERMGIMYKFVIYDGTEYIWENNFTDENSWWNNRYVDFKDQGGKKMLIVHRWNEPGTPAPKKVMGFTTSPGNGKVYLGWQKSFEPHIAYYSIFRRPGAGSFTNIANISASNDTYIDESVVNGTTYDYYIVAVAFDNTAGEPSVTNSVKPTTGTDSVKPSLPEGLVAYAYSTNQIILKWNPNTEGDLAGYYVYRSNTGSPGVKLNSEPVPPIEQPYYIDTVIPGTNYYYWVAALDEAGNITNSKDNMIKAKLVKVKFILDMGNVHPDTVEIYGNRTPLSWTDGIELEKASDYDYSITLGLIAGETYQYRYKYNDSVMEKDFDTPHRNREITVATDKVYIEIENDWEETPEIPQNVWAFPLDGKVYLHWDSVEDEVDDLAGYNIYYTTTPGGMFSDKINSTPISSNSFIVSGLNNNTTYYFVVRAVDGGSLQLESPDSVPVSATPKKPVPVYFKTELRTISKEIFVYNYKLDEGFNVIIK